MSLRRIIQSSVRPRTINSLFNKPKCFCNPSSTRVMSHAVDPTGTPDAMLDYWFGLEMKQWFISDPVVDEAITSKYGSLIDMSRTGKLLSWRESARGRLAEIIINDQFSRNVFRGTPQMYASDALALKLCLEGIALGHDKELTNINEKMFFYLPIEHAEDMQLHDDYYHLFREMGNPILQYFEDHKNVCERFGRYPSRNKILGRENTVEEEEFLKSHKGW